MKQDSLLLAELSHIALINISHASRVMQLPAALQTTVRTTLQYVLRAVLDHLLFIVNP